MQIFLILFMRVSTLSEAHGLCKLFFIGFVFPRAYSMSRGENTVITGNETISAYTRVNVTIWMILAFQGGLLNIGGLLACHSFVSHVTGFATLFGLELNRVHYWAASGMLAVPLFFLFCLLY